MVEGVETKEDLERCLDAGVRYMQGFALGAPLPLSDALLKVEEGLGVIFVPELAQVLLPWWVLGVWLWPSWWWVWAPIGAYLAATHVALRWAARKSQKDGFQRVIRLPVARLSCRRCSVGRYPYPAVSRAICSTFARRSCGMSDASDKSWRRIFDMD